MVVLLPLSSSMDDGESVNSASGGGSGSGGGDGGGDGGGGREGSARRGNATTSQHNERTRGRCNKRMTRDDGATTSWRNETTIGSMTRRRDIERAARREGTQQQRAAQGATRG